MVDAFAPSNMREATGPPTFICHVRPTYFIFAGSSSTNVTSSLCILYKYKLWSFTQASTSLNFLCACFSVSLSTSDHPEEEFGELLEELLSGAKARGVVLSPQEEFHLSLSQTVVLRHHWIQPFTQSLRTGLAHCKRCANTKYPYKERIDLLFLNCFFIWIFFFTSVSYFICKIFARRLEKVICRPGNLDKGQKNNS